MNPLLMMAGQKGFDAIFESLTGNKSSLPSVPSLTGASSGPIVSSLDSGKNYLTFNNPFSVSGQGGWADASAAAETSGAGPETGLGSTVASDPKTVIILGVLAFGIVALFVRK